MFSFKEKNFFKFFFFNFNVPTPFHSWSVHSPMFTHKLNRKFFEKRRTTRSTERRRETKGRVERDCGTMTLALWAWGFEKNKLKVKCWKIQVFSWKISDIKNFKFWFKNFESDNQSTLATLGQKQCFSNLPIDLLKIDKENYKKKGFIKATQDKF